MRHLTSRTIAMWSIVPLLVIVSAGVGILATSLTSPAHSATSQKILTGRQTAAAPAAANQGSLSGWHLIWHDEFNGSVLDRTKWNIQSNDSGGYQGCCLEDGEQYWTAQAINVQNGILRIASEKQAHGGTSYTSGAITTEHMFDFLYGRVEIRARLPKTRGLWPALWMLPSGAWWQARAPYEIDLMELLGQDPTTVYLTNHWGDAYQMCTFTGDDFSRDFHVFAVQWEPHSVTWYVDGIQRCHVTTGVSDRPMYLILSTAVGGTWVGAPDNSSAFPQFLDVDYVRVYQSDQGR